METEEDNYYDIEKWLCLDKELSYCLNIAKEKYFHIDKSYRFTSIKNMKNIINKIKEYIYMYIKYVPLKMVLLVIQSTIVRYVEKNLSKS